MERRFILFLSLCFLVLMLNGMWSARQIAEREQAKQPAAAKAKPEADEVADVAAADGAAADDEDAAEAADVPEAAGEDAAAEDAADEEPGTAAEFVTLGSVDAESDYRMLVTLTNRGAGVRRVELSSPKYLDLHDRGGYLGHLELAADAGAGLLVQAVGAGTPAAKAGVQVGDRLVEAGVKQRVALKAPADLEKQLRAARPRHKMSLVVDRNGERKTLEAVLARRPLEVMRPESENVLLRGEPLPPDFIEPPSFLMTLEQIGEDKIAAEAKELRGVELWDANWRIVDRGEQSVTFERRAASGLMARKRYELAKAPPGAKDKPDAPAYHLMLTLTLENDAGEGGRSRRVAYRLDGPNGLPVEGWWYATKVGREWGAVGLRDVVGRYFEAPPQQIGGPTIAVGKAEPFEGANQMAYMGVDAQYFCTALIPQYANAEERWIAAARPVMLGPPLPRGSTKTHYVNVTARLVSEPASLKAGEKLTHRYQVFVGPKRPELIAQYHPADSPGYSIRDFVYYGWFGGVARAMVGLLHVFYSILGNYGLAIIALTVLVRGCMFPVSRGQARSMAKLQELRPEMEKIKEKYKGDQQKQAQAMQQLYRKYNVNPLAGCLPMLIQLPVFVGLWRGLAVDIELRQAPLFGHSIRWCSNLAAPDMLFDWSGFMPELITRREGFLWLGPYLNLLPLVTIGLFLWQQKMFMPEPANEQAAMQQKVMKWMMVVMSVFFYKVPSGLCLYLIASSLWGIAERKLVPPPTAGAAAAGAAGPSPAAGRAGPGGAGSDKRAVKNGQPRDKRGAKSKRRR